MTRPPIRRVSRWNAFLFALSMWIAALALTLFARAVIDVVRQ